MENSSASQETSYHRVVVKVGSGLLTVNDDLNTDVMADLVQQIAGLHSKGVEVLLVTSGAMAVGRHALGIPRGEDSIVTRQGCAAVGQGMLMSMYIDLFAKHQINAAQVLVTRSNIANNRVTRRSVSQARDISYLYVRNVLHELLERRAVPVINENDVVAVDEIAGADVFGDNDTLSGMVSSLVDADLLIILGQVDGLYPSDPNTTAAGSQPEIIRTVRRINKEIEAMAGPPSDQIGRGGMRTKVEAAKEATSHGADVVIANGQEPDVLARIFKREPVGTLFRTTISKQESRRRRLLKELELAPNRREIVIDDGAIKALRDRNRSLLPAGVTRVRGSFSRGDAVYVVSSGNVQVACGTTNYGSADMRRIMGKHTAQIPQELEHFYGQEVVHRNNLVNL